MPIDPFLEQTFPFAQAARRLPALRNDRPVHPATLWRWASHGVRGVRLETVKVGGTTCTSLEVLRRFFAALDGDAPALAAPLAAPAADKAAADLDAIGI